MCGCRSPLSSRARHRRSPWRLDCDADVTRCRSASDQRRARCSSERPELDAYRLASSPTCICLAVRILERARPCPHSLFIFHLRFRGTCLSSAPSRPGECASPCHHASAIPSITSAFSHPSSRLAPSLSLLLFRLRHSSCPLHPKIPRSCPTGSPSASGGSQPSSSVRSVMGSLRNSCRRHPVWAR